MIQPHARDAAIAVPAGVPTRLVRMRQGALDDLPAVLSACGIDQPGPYVLIADQRTWGAAGQRVAAVLTDAGKSVSRLVLADDEHGHVGGTIEQVRQLTAQVASAAAVVGIGAGVINDLGKLAASQVNRPYISVATAASMNGYGSPVAAIVEDGIKKTLPTDGTLAIVVDLDVVAAAPIDLARSGFADLLSKSSATACWKLAQLVRDDAYDHRPHELLEPVVQQCAGHAPAVGKGDPHALGLLMQGLIYGGFAMTLAGRSSPASGGEHLLSHYWDMQAYAAGGQHHLHGYQVAIGTRVCAALYHRLSQLPIEAIDVDRLAGRWLAWEKRRERLRQAHGPLFDAVEPEARRQQLSLEQYRAELAHVRSVWPAIQQVAKNLVMTPEKLLTLHQQACVPTHPEAVGQTLASVRHTLLHAADVRARYTVLDLAESLGVLEPWADDILADAGLLTR